MGEESVNVVPPAPESIESSILLSEQPAEFSCKAEVEADPAEKPTSQKVVEKAVPEAENEDRPPQVAVEEKTALDAEENTVAETLSESTYANSVADRESSPGNIEASVGSFREDTDDVNDLKESEKRTLQGLRAKIEQSINENTFFAPAKPKTGSSKAKVKKKEAGKKGADAKSRRKGKAEGGIVSSEVAEPGEEEQLESPLPLSVEPTEEKWEEAAAVEDETKVATTDAHDPSIEMDGEKLITDAGIEQHDSLQDLSLWGVPLLPSKGDERLDVILLKFLRARDFKLNNAFRMLQKTITWRQIFKADILIDEEIAATEFDSFAYLHGYDKQGHPVCYNNFGIFQDKELYQKIFDNEVELNRFLRWRIQLLEKGIQQLNFKPVGVSSMVQVTDLMNFPGLLKRRNLIKKIASVLLDNYPGLVAKQIIINVPCYFGALYSLPGFSVARRMKKIVLARPQKVTETLFQYISPEYVPLKYGGLSRPNDTEFEGVNATVNEVIVKASQKQTIELQVEQSGMTVIWDVAVVGWDVVYGEEFVPRGEGSYTVIIKKSRKVAPSEEAKRNSFRANEPGTVVLTIDNTATKKNRLAVYRYISKHVASSAA